MRVVFAEAARDSGGARGAGPRESVTVRLQGSGRSAAARRIKELIFVLMAAFSDKLLAEVSSEESAREAAMARVPEDLRGLPGGSEAVRQMMCLFLEAWAELSDGQTERFLDRLLAMWSSEYGRALNERWLVSQQHFMPMFRLWVQQIKDGALAGSSRGGGGGGPARGGGRGRGRGDGNTRDAPYPPHRSGVCYMFRDNGTCMFGDQCRFSHGAVAQAPAAQAQAGALALYTGGAVGAGRGRG